jgi:hypothetical protein
MDVHARRHQTFAENPAKRAALAQEALERAQQEKIEAQEWARKRGVPMRYDDGRRIMELIAVRDGVPVYYTTRNHNAAVSTAADQVRNAAPFNANGAGLTVGVWDGGAVLATHPELAGRVVNQDAVASDYHATHVGGTIGASGVVSNALGMAPAVNMDSYDWNADIAEMISRAAASPGETNAIYLSNHSYGTVGGWTWGLSGLSAYQWPSWLTWGAGEVDIYFGRYDVGAANYDDVVYNAPYYLPFVAAGNDRSDNPASGETVYYLRPLGPINGKWTAVSYDDTAHPLGDGIYKNGYDTISAEATAKNIMTVGAVNDAVAGATRSVGDASMATFSSWGPADDGRIKPDIVANGIDLYSCWNNDFDLGDYYSISGTSMATPNACGSAALLVDYYRQRFPGGDMLASTLKGLIIHTADDLGNPGPDYAYGWGLVNTLSAAQLLQDFADGNSLRLTEAMLSVSNNVSDEYQYESTGTEPIRVTLCWTDPPGPEQTAHDSRASVLVHDLDLKIIGPDGDHYPYSMDYTHPSSNATAQTKNDVDNIEQVFIAAPVPGPYTIRIDYDGSLQDEEQHYSLLVSGLTTNTAPLDTDMDGMPDDWEWLYFSSPTAGIAWVDSDGDGADNLSEFISGHNPTNAGSYFSISSSYYSPSTGDTHFVVSWNSVSGRIYGVNWSGMLTNSFTNISGNLPYPAGSYTDSVNRAGDAHFYRIDVQLAP